MIAIFSFFDSVGFLIAALVGAVIAAIVHFFVKKTRVRVAQLVSERDAKEQLLQEMRKLEKFRRDFISLSKTSP